MDLFNNLAIGFGTALKLTNLAYAFVGCLLGTLIGVLPGLGPLTTIAMLLPITYALSPDAALIMLAGIYYGAQYGGSTTAIVVNLPGESSSVVTTIDGSSDGPAGPRRRRAVDRGDRLVLRRLRRDAGDRGTCAAARVGRAAVRPEGILLADDPRPAAGDRAVERAVHRGRRHDPVRHAAEPDRHRRQHRHATLCVRHPAAVRRPRFRAAGDGHLRLRRNRQEPRAARGTDGDDAKDHQHVPDAGGFPPDDPGDPARHRTRHHARRAAGRRRGAVVVRGLYAREEALEAGRRNSAMAPSRAWRDRRLRTMPARRRRSFRC